MKRDRGVKERGRKREKEKEGEGGAIIPIVNRQAADLFFVFAEQ